MFFPNPGFTEVLIGFLFFSWIGWLIWEGIFWITSHIHIVWGLK